MRKFPCLGLGYISQKGFLKIITVVQKVLCIIVINVTIINILIIIIIIFIFIMIVIIIIISW